MNRDNLPRPLLVQYYQQYLVDQDIDAYIRTVSARYTTGTLERIVLCGDRITRRSSILALGRLADYRSNHILGCALVDSDRGVRALAENGILRVWMRVGNPAQQRQLAAISEQIEEKDLEHAVQNAGKLIQDAPWIAEGWFQRGKAYFQGGRYDEALNDCHQALEINPYHFVAASMMGQSYLLQSDPVSALESFRRALRLNPCMEEVRAQVINLQRSLKGE